MKRLNKLFIPLLACTTLLSSCEKQLFESPYAQLDPESAFSSPDRIEKTATGMYDALQNREFLGGRVLIYADIRGIDGGVPSYFGDIPNFQTLRSDNLLIEDAFVGAYRTINEANLFLKNIEIYAGVASQDAEARYKAEAKFIRALTYFYLVNLWAQPYAFTSDASHLGVPLVLTASDTPFAEDNRIARSTVKQVYDQIIKDLEEARPALPSVNPQARDISNVGRATKGAVDAFLARVYLYQKNYNKALEYANAVITSDDYGLNDSPAATFSSYTTQESIFSVAHNGADNPNTNHALNQHYSPNLRADIQAGSELVNLMSQSDLRRTELITVSDGSFWNGKFKTIGDWAPIFRYSEILLTKAEAIANLASGTSVDAEALDLVNQVRERSDPSTTVVAATKAQLISNILTERRIELAFEGHGIFEFLRTGRNIPAHGSINEQLWGSDRVIFPFPQSERLQNPNLEQNDDY